MSQGVRNFTFLLRRGPWDTKASQQATHLHSNPTNCKKSRPHAPRRANALLLLSPLSLRPVCSKGFCPFGTSAFLQLHHVPRACVPQQALWKPALQSPQMESSRPGVVARQPVAIEAPSGRPLFLPQEPHTQRSVSRVLRPRGWGRSATGPSCA